MVLLAPSAAPQSVEAVAINTSSILVTWRPPPDQHHNGVIIGYRVRYSLEWTVQDDLSSEPPRDATTIMNTGSDRSCLISGLATWTVYGIWVSAFTRAGEGPSSDVIVVQTEEGGMFLRVETEIYHLVHFSSVFAKRLARTSVSIMTYFAGAVLGKNIWGPCTSSFGGNSG